MNWDCETLKPTIEDLAPIEHKNLVAKFSRDDKILKLNLPCWVFSNMDDGSQICFYLWHSKLTKVSDFAHFSPQTFVFFQSANPEKSIIVFDSLTSAWNFLDCDSKCSKRNWNIWNTTNSISKLEDILSTVSCIENSRPAVDSQYVCHFAPKVVSRKTKRHFHVKKKLLLKRVEPTKYIKYEELPTSFQKLLGPPQTNQ